MHPLDQAAQLARDGDLESLARALSSDPNLLRARSATGDTLLGLACRAATGDVAIPPDPGTAGQHAAVDLILEAGPDLDAADDSGWAPLHTAAMAGHSNLARRLLAAGASRDGRVFEATGGSPLAVALFYAKTETARVLADPAVPDNLRHAAALGRDLERFIDHGRCSSGAREGVDFYGQFPWFPSWNRTLTDQEILDEALTWAARNDQSASLRWLITHGANVDASPFRGTALLWAVYGNAAGAIITLLGSGADPNLRHDFGGRGHGDKATALHLAAQFDATKSVALLLDGGADPHIRDNGHGGTPLEWAEFSGAREAAGVLRERS